MAAQERPYQPSWSRRTASALTIGTIGFLSRSFLYALNRTETHGLDKFLQIIDRRKDVSTRERGLITVSNHVSVLDDPMIWGVLPYRYFWNPNNMRWSLGSYDICFKNGKTSMLSAFFTLGNTLPVQRLAHSQYGGLFQPTMTEVIRLLSDPHAQSLGGALAASRVRALEKDSLPLSDPFSAAELTYTTNGFDSFPAPSAYPSRRFSWIHIFPEGMIHQHPNKVMRYFKWGVARLILEAEPCPDVLPMWIDGPQQVYDNERGWPKPLPRPGKEISITFGDLLDAEAVFGPFREKWRAMKERARLNRLTLFKSDVTSTELPPERLGEVQDDELRYGSEAEQLRIDVTMAVRNEVLKVRRSRGFPDEDPKRSLAETFRKEGGKATGVMQDGSVVQEN